MKTLFAAAAVSTVGLMAAGSAAAPPPSSWALMLVGFGGLGAMLRLSRQRRVVRAPA